MSTNLCAAERQTLAADFVQLIAAHDFDRADRMLPDLPAAPGDAAHRAAATLHMQRERWAEAADVLASMANANADSRMHLRLCRNLAAIKTHRPEAYRAIADIDLGEAYALHATASGRMTIAARIGAKTVLLGNAVDPAEAAAKAMQQLAAALRSGECLALLSVGDGYLLDAVARQSPELPLGRRQAIYLFEPDARLLLACLLLHDFTGEDGPIERANVLWFVGPRWADAFKLAVHTERYLPFPKTTIKQAIDAKPIEVVLAQTLESLGRLDTESQREITRHYGALVPADFASALAGRVGRPPRVLLVTTRFSTVLQYSTCDTADAFRQLGFEAQVLIEPSPHHALTRLAIRRTLADFKPDLIFQIDHHRFEHGDLFPPNVPFVNWIQDLLPHLMTPAAGQKLGGNDFVLTPSLQRWADEFAYPPGQCMEFRKLTRVPVRPVSGRSDDRRVVYVSNWSQSPRQIRDELVRWAGGQRGALIGAACDRMTRAYEAGHCLHTPGDCRRLLTDAIGSNAGTVDETFLRDAATRLFDRMNNLLYRHQGLRWAAQACGQNDLRLEIYGQGWDAHQAFARYARGNVEYGRELETLTRTAGVNLVLEPFVCVSHQRLLDAMVAGGFCLIRSHPSTQLLHDLIERIGRAGNANIETAVDLLAALPAADRGELKQIIEACASIEAGPGTTDFVASVVRQQRAGFLPSHGRLLPHLESVSFDNAEQLSTALSRFSRDAELRSTIARTQRQAIESRYCYAAGMARVVEFVQQRLTSGSGRRRAA